MTDEHQLPDDIELEEELVRLRGDMIPPRPHSISPGQEVARAQLLATLRLTNAVRAAAVAQDASSAQADVLARRVYVLTWAASILTAVGAAASAFQMWRWWHGQP